MSRIKVILLSLVAAFALSAVASASASAMTLQWEVCEEGSGTGTKYPNSKCKESEAGSGTWEWKVLKKGDERSIESAGGPQKLIGRIGANPIEIECAEVQNDGVIKGGEPGTDEAHVIYHGCGIVGAEAGCSAKSPGKRGGVISLGVETKLVEIEAGVEGDEFKPPNEGTTFVEIELGKTENEETQKYEAKCGVFPRAVQKVEGVVVGKAEVGPEGNLCEVLNFTKPPQKGSTLEFAKATAEYVGEVEVSLVNDWAARCA
jgi:hypothetical protein